MMECKKCYQMQAMTKHIKSGYLLRYKKRFFGKNWKKEFCVLFGDSTLAWFKDQGSHEPDGGVILKDSPDMIAMGEYTLRVPNMPDLPSGASVRELVAFGSRRTGKIHWFLCKTKDELNDWMTAISNVLPPPPGTLDRSFDSKEESMNYLKSLTATSLPASFEGLTDTVYPPPPAFASSQPAESMPSLGGSSSLIDNQLKRRASIGGLTTGVLMGAAMANMGHGWGWGWGFGETCGGGYDNLDTGFHAQIDNQFLGNHSMMVHQSAGKLAGFYGDEYEHVFDDGGFDMGDFGGDFGF